MSVIEIVNNDSSLSSNGDIVSHSGENFGCRLALADKPSEELIGVWIDAPRQGHVGKISDDLVKVNCVAPPIPGEKLYLSSTVKGKATHIQPENSYFIGICIADQTDLIGYKALVQFNKSGVPGSEALNLSNAIVVVGTGTDIPTMPVPPPGKFYIYFQYQ